MIEIGREFTEHTCCLCLSDEESSFHSNSVLRSHSLKDMVDYCIGVQLNDITTADQAISTSICNECVLNVSNFYSFKKKIIEAQTFLGALVDDTTEDHIMESKIEDVLSNDLVSDGNEEQIYVEEHLRSPDSIELEELLMTDDIKQSPEVQHEVQTKRGRPTESKTQKRQKVTPDAAERVTIQMNECLICPSILGDIHQLDNHIASHKDIKCKVCHRSFARYSNLKRHFTAVHSKPKPFQCDLCGLGFSFSVNLQAHAALHYSGKIRMKQ